jgi:hypothetical protein
VSARIQHPRRTGHQYAGAVIAKGCQWTPRPASRLHHLADGSSQADGSSNRATRVGYALEPRLKTSGSAESSATVMPDTYTPPCMPFRDPADRTRFTDFPHSVDMYTSTNQIAGLAGWQQCRGMRAATRISASSACRGGGHCDGDLHQAAVHGLHCWALTAEAGHRPGICGKRRALHLVRACSRCPSRRHARSQPNAEPDDLLVAVGDTHPPASRAESAFGAELPLAGRPSRPRWVT